MAARRMLIIGGDAAGMSAASQARRLKRPDELEILAFERSAFTSYSACGIPYWVGGVVDGPDALVARTAAEHRARGIDLRMHTEVTAIDTAAQRVRVRDREGGERWEGYDELVVATGARPCGRTSPASTRPACTGCRTSTTAGRCTRPSARTPRGCAPWSSARATSVWRWPRPW